MDFADISTEFDKTNQAYFEELQSELGDELEHYSDLFISPEEVDAKVDNINAALFQYDLSNKEVFSDQVSEINDKETIRTLVKALNDARSLYNLLWTQQQYEALQKLDFHLLFDLFKVAKARLDLINTKEAMEQGTDSARLLSLALEDVIFAFVKVGEEEMKLADEFRNALRKARRTLEANFDQRDPVFISLKEELERLFKNKNLKDVSKEEMEGNIKELESIHRRATELKRKNELLKAKYDLDEKYVRLHKRLMEQEELNVSEIKLYEALSALKAQVDDQVLQNARMLENEDYAERMLLKLVIEQFLTKSQIPIDAMKSKYINKLVVAEYLNEYNNTFHSRPA